MSYRRKTTRVPFFPIRARVKVMMGHKVSWLGQITHQSMRLGDNNAMAPILCLYLYLLQVVKKKVGELVWPQMTFRGTSEVIQGHQQSATKNSLEVKKILFNPPPPGGGGVGSDPPPLGFSGITSSFYYCIDMKLGTALRASIWRRLVQRKSKSAGNFFAIDRILWRHFTRFWADKR